MTFWVVVIVAVAALAVAAYLRWQSEQKRRETLFAWAAANKWTFEREDFSLCERWHGTPFDDGDHRHARNVVSGAWKGASFMSFDYSYQTHTSDGRGGRSTTTHHFAVTAVRLPTWLPRLQVTPETMLTRLGNAVGHTDIELESEAFNRTFRVHADDPKFASDVLTPRTMQMLLSRPHFSWRIEGTDIICWQGSEQKPAAVVAAIGTLFDVVAGIPSFVWSDHDLEAGSTTAGGTA